MVQGVSYDRTEVTVFFVDYGNSSTVPVTSVGVIPPSLVSCLPAQAVQCRLSGLHNTGNADIMDKWTNIISEKIKIKVEGVDCGVHVVQATTLPPPGVNINQEVCNRGGERHCGATLNVGDVEEILVTWVESTIRSLPPLIHALGVHRSRFGFTGMLQGCESHFKRQGS